MLQGSSQPPTKTAQLHFTPGHPALTPPDHPAALTDPAPLSTGSIPAPAAPSGRAKDGAADLNLTSLWLRCKSSHLPGAFLLCTSKQFPAQLCSPGLEPLGHGRRQAKPLALFFFFFPKHFFPNLNHHLSSQIFFFQ